ncbi:MAG: hypothetical protein OER04_02850 [Cyclobacteriaceae bacterium]|nr:hypothetical protein [Cyclobacteriaceae bacterium]
MKPLALSLLIMILAGAATFAQEKSSYEIDFTDPKSVVNAIFYAAKSKNLAILETLCDPSGVSDGDTWTLCSMSEIARQTGVDRSESSADPIKEFVSMFAVGKITGDVSYEAQQGTEYANVPFWFNHPGGEGRSNESMTLVKRGKNWYLSSF